MRSPSSAPWVKGELGSIESTATSPLAPACQLDQAADERGLPDPGRAGEADDRGAPGARIDLAHQRPALRIVVLDERDGARQRALVAGEQALGEVGGGAVRGRARARTLRSGSAHLEHPHGARQVARACRRVRPGEVQVGCAAEAGLADRGMAVVEVAVPADPAERAARVVLARLGPAGKPGDVGPRASRARLDVHGQPERVLAERLVADRPVALGDPDVVAADEIEARRAGCAGRDAPRSGRGPAPSGRRPSAPGCGRLTRTRRSRLARSRGRGSRAPRR